MATARRKYHGVPHYITGLGEGVSDGKKATADNKNNKNGAAHDPDEAYVSYLRKNARDRPYHRLQPQPVTAGHQHQHQQQQLLQQQQQQQHTADDAKWGYYYSLHDPSATSIGPWQIAAFALLGAVILLSALFLHILADGGSDGGSYHHHSSAHHQNAHQHQHGGGNGSSSKKKNSNHHSTSTRRSSRRSLKKKKTDEWSDDASDVEADLDLLSESVRGHGAYNYDRSESFDVPGGVESSSSNHHHAYYNDFVAPTYPQQLSRHRKNSSTSQQQNYYSQQQQQLPQQPQQPVGSGVHRSIYQNAYRCPTPSARLAVASSNMASFSPSIVQRHTVSPALVAATGPPMPTRLLGAENSSGESSAAAAAEGGIRAFSSASSMESFSNHGEDNSLNSSSHHHHVQPPALLPRSGMRSGGQRRPASGLASPAVTIQEPIHEDRSSTPDPGPRELLLPPQALLMDKTPRARNGKVINTVDGGGAGNAIMMSPDRQLSEIESGTEDSPYVMPYLPNLSLNNEQQPTPVNLSDMHLLTMESGNVDWLHSPRQSPRPSASRSNSSSSRPPACPSIPDYQHQGYLVGFAEQPEAAIAPRSYKGDATEHVIEMSESVECDESLDSGDPRKNIQHKRDSLIHSTDSAASLQGAVNFDELELKEVIGGGGFGQVWKAMWRGTPVAVKVLTGSAQAHHVPRAILEEFAAEINLLKGMRHPNICLYMGACLAPPNRAIITELAANGSLWDALRLPLMPPFAPADGVTRHAWPMCLYQPDPRHGTPPSMKSMRTNPHMAPKGSWPWILVKRVACGSARGMAYLHSGTPPVLHRDLKSANILLDESYTPKVCDFGLSRLKAQDRSMTGNCGTVQWMAPEVLANQSYNEKADVYSYGIILWELLSRQCPYDDMSAIQCALAVLNKNHRPEIPRWCPPSLQVLIRSCFKKNPDERPNFTEILQTLDEMP